eukprot:IDg21983t1
MPRLCVHRNRDAERDSLRTDAAVISHNGFRTLYSAASSYGFLIGKGDIRGAYTQSGEARRKVYVKPPFSLSKDQSLWLLNSTMYGLVSAGRKWQIASDEVMVSLLNLRVVIGMPQMFTKFKDGNLVLLIAKYVDDIPVAA